MIEKNILEYNKNFFNEINYTWGIVVAGDDKTGYNGMTVSWGGIGVIWHKNVCYLFVRKSRYTYEFLQKSKNSSISFLGNEYKDAKTLFGRRSGRELDKFKETGLTAEYDQDTNTYYVKEATDTFILKTLYEVDMPIDELPEALVDRFYPTKDIHTMYVCEIVKYLTK